MAPAMMSMATTMATEATTIIMTMTPTADDGNYDSNMMPTTPQLEDNGHRQW